MKREGNPPTLKVKQRILFKRTNFTCNFFNGYAEVTYDNPKVAQETYKRMVANKQKADLEDNTIKEYRKGLSSWDIFDLYMNDIKNAMKKNGAQMKIEFELL